MAFDKKTDHHYLLNITTAVFVLVIVGNIVSLAKQYPPKFIKFEAAQVQGYVRPDKLGSQPGKKAKPVKRINLLQGLSPQQQQLLQQRFDQAASLIHAKQYDYAVMALTEVIKIQPRLPEAHANLGYSYLGLKQYQAAVKAFSNAINLRPNQVNAYYGLAESFEGLKDYEAALGAMRSFIHLSPPTDPFVAKARAAVWEWETKLGRKPSVDKQDQNLQFDPKRFISPHNH